MSLYQFALLWLVGTNLLAVVLTVSDKVRAKKGKWRVPEDTLLFVALLGGAVGTHQKVHRLAFQGQRQLYGNAALKVGKHAKMPFFAALGTGELHRLAACFNAIICT